jgi:CxxC-x17-CxxC domain-containing protein
MAFQDKTIQCSDCGKTFTFTADEQEFYKSKGYTNEPKRCPTCRQARKSERYGSSSSSPRTTRSMYPVKCAQCGKDTEVPFEPRGDKPVYCSDCYRQMKTTR